MNVPNYFEGVNANSLTNSCESALNSLKEVLNTDIKNDVLNKSIWISDSQNTLSTAFAENEDQINGRIIPAIERFMRAMPLVKQVQDMQKEMKSIAATVSSLRSSLSSETDAARRASIQQQINREVDRFNSLNAQVESCVASVKSMMN